MLANFNVSTFFATKQHAIAFVREYLRPVPQMAWDVLPPFGDGVNWGDAHDSYELYLNIGRPLCSPSLIWSDRM